eukprot:GHVR01183255.1.p2 GENE.GHVR01183255.1~~GHVR01183255.1.p2  ORF type:complete len:110 (-),score=0.83 GHVR01183255.1:179-508(-)
MKSKSEALDEYLFSTFARHQHESIMGIEEEISAMQSISNTMPISLRPASRRVEVESTINPLPFNTLERPSRHPDRLLRGEYPLSPISCRLEAVTFVPIQRQLHPGIGSR